jgi:hypothetical protein
MARPPPHLHYRLAESGDASDETIRDMGGHVSRQMLKPDSHIGMEAKRRAGSIAGFEEGGTSNTGTENAADSRRPSQRIHQSGANQLMD